MQRSMLIFENSIKSSATRKTYLGHLNKFMSFCGLKDYDGLAAIPQEKMQIHVEDCNASQKNNISQLHQRPNCSNKGVLGLQ
ncbi:MAG: hypothetical protein IIA82_02660 [Thaumarchaeota archaeon]|nr:hypothetical protein [Nitrososphaerota archaeon]